MNLIWKHCFLLLSGRFEICNSLRLSVFGYLDFFRLVFRKSIGFILTRNSSYEIRREIDRGILLKSTLRNIVLSYSPGVESTDRKLRKRETGDIVDKNDGRATLSHCLNFHFHFHFHFRSRSLFPIGRTDKNGKKKERNLPTNTNAIFILRRFWEYRDYVLFSLSNLKRKNKWENKYINLEVILRWVNSDKREKRKEDDL